MSQEDPVFWQAIICFYLQTWLHNQWTSLKTLANARIWELSSLITLNNLADTLVGKPLLAC